MHKAREKRLYSAFLNSLHNVFNKVRDDTWLSIKNKKFFYWQVLAACGLTHENLEVDWVTVRDYCITGRANPIFCAVGLR